MGGRRKASSSSSAVPSSSAVINPPATKDGPQADLDLGQANLKIQQQKIEMEQLSFKVIKFKETLGFVNDRLEVIHNDFTRQYEELRKTIIDNLDDFAPSSSCTVVSEEFDRESKSSNENEEDIDPGAIQKSRSKTSSSCVDNIELEMEKLYNGEPEDSNDDGEKFTKEDENLDIIQKALISTFDTKDEDVQQEYSMILSDQEDRDKDSLVSPKASQVSKLLSYLEDSDEDEGKENEKMEINNDNDKQNDETITSSPVPVIKKGIKRTYFTMKMAPRKDDKDILSDEDEDVVVSPKDEEKNEKMEIDESDVEKITESPGIKKKRTKRAFTMRNDEKDIIIDENESRSNDSESSESDHEETKGFKKKVKLDNNMNSTPKSKPKRKRKAKSKSVGVGLRRGRSRESTKCLPTKNAKTKGPVSSTKYRKMDILEKSSKTRTGNKAEDKENDSAAIRDILARNKDLIIPILSISSYLTPITKTNDPDCPFTVTGEQFTKMENSIKKGEINFRSKIIKDMKLTLMSKPGSAKSRGRPQSAKVFNKTPNISDVNMTPRLILNANINTRLQRKLTMSSGSGDIPVITIQGSGDDSEVDSGTTDAEIESSTRTSPNLDDSDSDKEESKEEMRNARDQKNLYNFEDDENENDNNSFLIRKDVFFGRNDSDDLIVNNEKNHENSSSERVHGNEEIETSAVDLNLSEDDENENENSIDAAGKDDDIEPIHIHIVEVESEVEIADTIEFEAAETQSI